MQCLYIQLHFCREKSKRIVVSLVVAKINLIQFWSQLTCLAHIKETGSRFYFEDISHISFILIYLSPL